MTKLATRLWSNLPLLSVAAFAVSATLPGYGLIPDLPRPWHTTFDVWAYATAALCAAAAVQPLADSRTWRLTAAICAVSFLLCRAVAVRLLIPDEAPGTIITLSVALAVNIGWSWGRPPIVRHKIATFPEPSR